MASRVGRAFACAFAAVAVLVAAAPASAQVVWAVGDGGVVENTDDQLAAYIEGRGAFERFVYLGDVYETGTAEEFAQNYHTSFGRFKERSSPTPGNHEWDNRATGYDPYWGSLAPQTDGGHYYSFDVGRWHFVSLNSEEAIDAGSPQIAWLKQDLARYKGTCTIAFMHKPRFSATPGVPADRPEQRAAWEALEGRAAALLTGHDHNYQRFHPINGLAQFIVGTGGRTFHSVTADPRLAHSNDQVVGALRLELSRGSAAFAFFATGATQPLDSGSLSCTPHDTPPTASFDWTPQTPTTGQEVTFTSTSSDPDGPLTALAWDLDGDGEHDDAQGETAARTFARAGSFQVGLRVTDGQGDSSTAIRQVDVGAAPGGDQPPPDPLASRVSVVSPKHGAVHSRRLRVFRGKVTGATGPVSVTLLRRGRTLCTRFDGRRFVRASCRTRAGVRVEASSRWLLSLPRSLRLQAGTYRLTARVAGADGVRRLAGVTFRVR